MASVEQLADLPLFDGIGHDVLTPLVSIAHERQCEEGEVLFEEGSEATRVYILLEGKVTIDVALSSRPEHITVALLSQPGQIVGWSGSVAQTSYTASARCKQASRLLTLDGKEFMDALEDNPSLGFIVMRRIADTISNRLRNIQRVVLKTL